jgi:hypothetical protein
MNACTSQLIRSAHSARTSRLQESGYIEQPFDIPDPIEPLSDPDDPSDLDDFDSEQDDDALWDVFIPDDDQYDVDPDLSDFEGSIDPEAWSEDFD